MRSNDLYMPHCVILIMVLMVNLLSDSGDLDLQTS